jgi:Zn-dependent M16 (insulinase) family peptidase
MGGKPHGSLSVAANILSLAYLWNEIRVKGGAYGTGVNSNRTGSFIAYSYRDPSPAKSLATYGTMPEFLDSFAEAPEGSIDGFIISTIAQTEPLVSPASKGRSADDFWFSGFTDEDRIRVRREILEATPAQLAGWHDAFAKLAAEGRVCVAGPASALETCEGLETVII